MHQTSNVRSKFSMLLKSSEKFPLPKPPQPPACSTRGTPRSSRTGSPAAMPHSSAPTTNDAHLCAVLAACTTSSVIWPLAERSTLTLTTGQHEWKQTQGVCRGLTTCIMTGNVLSSSTSCANENNTSDTLLFPAHNLWQPGRAGAPAGPRSSCSQPMRWMISTNTVGRSESGLVKIWSSTPCARTAERFSAARCQSLP